MTEEKKLIIASSCNKLAKKYSNDVFEQHISADINLDLKTVLQNPEEPRFLLKGNAQFIFLCNP